MNIQKCLFNTFFYDLKMQGNNRHITFAKVPFETIRNWKSKDTTCEKLKYYLIAPVWITFTLVADVIYKTVYIVLAVAFKLLQMPFKWSIEKEQILSTQKKLYKLVDGTFVYFSKAFRLFYAKPCIEALWARKKLSYAKRFTKEAKKQECLQKEITKLTKQLLEKEEEMQALKKSNFLLRMTNIGLKQNKLV